MRRNWMRVILHAGQRSKQNHKDENLLALPQEPIPIGKTWTDVVPGEYSPSGYAVSKKLIHLLRHARILREDDGAVEFWRIEDDIQEHFQHCHHLSDDKWKKSMAGGVGNKTRYQYCIDSSGTNLYLRALQGHSGRSLIDP